MPGEAKARIKINSLLQDSGWRFFDEKTGPKNIEVEDNVNLESLGDDFEHGKGFIDYLLLDTKGFPLAVFEAKSQSKDPVVGKKQAEDFEQRRYPLFLGFKPKCRKNNFEVADSKGFDEIIDRLNGNVLIRN